MLQPSHQTTSHLGPVELNSLLCHGSFPSGKDGPQLLSASLPSTEPNSQLSPAPRLGNPSQVVPPPSLAPWRSSWARDTPGASLTPLPHALPLHPSLIFSAAGNTAEPGRASLVEIQLCREKKRKRDPAYEPCRPSLCRERASSLLLPPAEAESNTSSSSPSALLRPERSLCSFGRSPRHCDACEDPLLIPRRRWGLFGVGAYEVGFLSPLVPGEGTDPPEELLLQGPCSMTRQTPAALPLTSIARPCPTPLPGLGSGGLLMGPTGGWSHTVPYTPCWELVPSSAAGFSPPGMRKSNLQADAGESRALIWSIPPRVSPLGLTPQQQRATAWG